MARILEENPDKGYCIVRSNFRNLKLVNQPFGYDKGNNILVETADLLCSGRIANEAAGRIHGDHFAFLVARDQYYEGSERSKDILASVVEMAKKLQMTVVAEGVETQVQVDYLKQIGCDLLQGFYFSKLVEVEEFLDRYYPNR